MDILAVETSAGSASVAYLSNGKVIGQSYINAGLTHSTTLMPMVEDMIKTANLKLENVDCFAVSSGPGSFTGLRIGISAVKGLALALNKPCVAVSTLEAIAWNFAYTNTVVCSLIDARCKRFFVALFRCTMDGNIERLCKDDVLDYNQIKEILAKYDNESVVLAGDGAETAFKLMGDIDNLRLAPQHQRYQQSIGVAMAGEKLAEAGKSVSSSEILPSYISIPQAQRELQKKLSNSTN